MTCYPKRIRGFFCGLNDNTVVVYREERRTESPNGWFLIGRGDTPQLWFARLVRLSSTGSLTWGSRQALPEVRRALLEDIVRAPPRCLRFFLFSLMNLLLWTNLDAFISFIILIYFYLGWDANRWYFLHKMMLFSLFKALIDSYMTVIVTDFSYRSVV